MDLTTYAGLQAAIADFLARDDLTTQIPGFIALAESKIKRRVRRKTIRATLDVSAESTPLPADCAELRSAYPLSGSPQRDRPLSIGTPSMLADIRANHWGVAGRPQAVAVVDGNLIVAPVPDQTYTLQLTYYQKLVPLSDAAPSNSVLDEAPDIYLYGALREAAPYLEHDERIATWQTRFDEDTLELDTVRQAEETSMALHKARLPVVF